MPKVSAPPKLGEVRLELKNVHALSDRETPALRGIDLRIQSGEIVGLAGVSGNGQAELAQVITGLRHAEQGQVLIDGKEMTGKLPAQIIRCGLAYIPEERMRDGMVQDFSISENIILRDHSQSPYASRGFLIHRIIAEFTDRLIRLFQIKTPSRETPARNLSGGNIQKVVLARELSRSPRIVIAAQPTRGLDIGATEYVHTSLLEQREKGAAILLISEDLDEVLALSDRVAVIYEGRMMGILDNKDAERERIGLLMAGVQAE